MLKAVESFTHSILESRSFRIPNRSSAAEELRHKRAEACSGAVSHLNSWVPPRSKD